MRDEFVMALTPPSIPFMPNGVTVDWRSRVWPEIGASALCASGSIRLAGAEIHWSGDAGVQWDPSLARVRAWPDARSLAARGRAVLAACSVEIPPVVEPTDVARALASSGLGVTESTAGRRAVHALLAALYHRDATRAALAAESLLGRGAGLTPEGDDLLCGATAAAFAAGAAGGLVGEARSAWLRAVCPADASARSSWLSVTLLRLASRGRVADPVIGILDPDEAGWPATLDRLLGIGSSTGLGYAVGLGCAALLLGASADGPAAARG